jgi:carbonic anhydrase/acetyltransferase-like protein (isoleucine patch superfamily)
VTEGAEIPPGSVVMGVPGRIVRQVTDADRQRIQHAARHYVEASARYRKSFPRTGESDGQ